MAPLPTCAPSRCENERITAPSSTVTPGPNTTLGSTVTSRPSLVSARRNTVSGATSVTPASSAACRSRCCMTASASASCALVLMPRTSSSVDFERDRLELHVARDRRPRRSDRIRPCALALPMRSRIVSATLAVERHQPAVAERRSRARCRSRRRARGWRRSSVALRHQPAVAGRIGGPEAEHRDRRAIGERGAQPLERLRRGSAACRRRSPGCRRRPRSIAALRRQHRMRGAAPLGLHEAPARPAATRALRPTTSSCSGPTTTAIARRFGRARPSAHAPSSERPATACSTFGRAERMRVPSPAASTIVRQVRPLIPTPSRSRRS